MYQKAIVSFLDVLGTKANRDFEAKLRVHRAFHESMRDFALRERAEAAYFRKAFAFSDCVYLVHAHRSDDSQSLERDDALIQTALFNTTLTTLRLLNEGHFVRGGIAFGDVFMDELGFFGPAFEKAYQLECEAGGMPRLVVEPELGERARAYSIRSHIAINEQLPASMRRTTLPELVKVDGEVRHLNPLYILEMEGRIDMKGLELTHEGLVSALRAKATSQLGDVSESVREKSRWMLEFVDGSAVSLMRGGRSHAWIPT